MKKLIKQLKNDNRGFFTPMLPMIILMALLIIGAIIYGIVNMI